MSCRGCIGGFTSPVYYAAYIPHFTKFTIRYVFFEKKRIFEREPKTRLRTLEERFIPYGRRLSRGTPQHVYIDMSDVHCADQTPMGVTTIVLKSGEVFRISDEFYYF